MSVFAAITGISLSVLPGYAEEDPVGIVTYVRGKWTQTAPDGKSEQLKTYSAIVEGAMLKAKDEKDQIEIRMGERRTVKRRGNKQAKEPIESAKDADNIWSRAMGLLSKHSNEFSTTMYKGGSDLHDAVILTSPEDADLTDVFKDMEPGQYLISLREKVLEGTSQPIGTFQVTVAKGANSNANANAKTLVKLDGAKPALYELSTIERKAGKEDVVLQKCWILICKEDKRQEAKAKWQVALEKTKDWQERPNACSRECFLKAIMYAIAKSQKDTAENTVN